VTFEDDVTDSSSAPAGMGGPLEDAAHYRRQLETVAQNATLALFIMDEHQRCTYMNRAAEQMTGFSLAELQGRALHYYVHHTYPDGRPYPLEECPIDRAFPQNMREQGEEVFVHKDGHFYPVAFTASPIRDGGRTVGTIIEARDITRERREQAERERLLDELRMERARLSTIFQQAPAFIATVRGPDHVFEMANPVYAQLVGHRDILGRPVREALPEAAEQGFVALLDQVYRSGEPFVGNGMRILLQRTPGAAPEERFLNFVYQPLVEADGSVSGILAHGVDVTEQVESQRRMEEQAVEIEAQKEELQLQAGRMEEVQVELELSNEELQETNESLARERAHLAAIIEYAPVGIVIAEAPSGRIVLGNRRVEEIFRHPALRSERVEEYAAWVAFHPDGRQVQAHEYPLARVLATGRAAGPDEYLYQRGDGTRAWVQITGVPIRDAAGALTGGLVVIDDIDAERRGKLEREQLIRELETERARLRTILTEAPAQIAVVRGPEYVFEFANPRYLASAGGREVLGRPALQVFPELASQGFREMLDTAYHGGEPLSLEEVPAAVDRDGTGVMEEGYYNLVLQPLRDAEGKVEALLSHTIDVTGQVRARREVEEKAEQLARAARALEASNQELDQFAYVASHDLKAPLRGIANLATWITEDLGDVASGEVQEHLELLQGRVHRMEGLIDGVLQYSRAGRVRQRPVRVDVGELVHEVVDLIAPPESVRVQVDEGMPALWTERLPLQQVFMNLIGNAVKYAGGDAPLVQVSAREAGDQWEFAVRDNGPGIAPEYHERIFGIFQTLEARDKVEGTGIGLSIVRKLVESRGGRVWVESKMGAGSTFRFLWPRSTEEGSGHE
jgi:PAS domain S-box-containing protein